MTNSKLLAVNGIREVSYRYELLSFNEIWKANLSVISAIISYNSEAVIKRTASFTLLNNTDVDWLSHKIKVTMRVKVDPNTYQEWPLGIFIPSTVYREINAGDVIKIESYDSSLILSEDKFINRYKIAAGTLYTNAIKNILDSSGIWKQNITPHQGAISTDKEFEIGTPKIEAINSLLKEINYTSLWVDENGYFKSMPYSKPNIREVKHEYRTDNRSVILTDGRIEESDIFNVPNVWVVTCTNPEKVALSATYVNENPSSKTSTVSRGRQIVDVRQIDDILDQSTLNDYVERLAYEQSSNLFNRITFRTPNMPNHGFEDCIWFEGKEMNVANKFIETQWEMNLSQTGDMVHVIKRVIFI